MIENLIGGGICAIIGMATMAVIDRQREFRKRIEQFYLDSRIRQIQIDLASLNFQLDNLFVRMSGENAAVFARRNAHARAVELFPDLPRPKQGEAV